MKKFLMVLCVSQGIFAVPELALIQQATSSVETTLTSFVMRASSKIIEVSQSDENVRLAVVGLAAVGVGFLVTRPYVCARNEALRQKTRADKLQLELESEKLRGQLNDVSRDCEEQKRTVTGLLAKLPTRRDLSGSEEELEI